MNKTAKGAIAAAAAAVLLLGGAGSLAYWTSEATVPGGELNTGHLALLTDGTNAGCGDWVLDDGTPYVEGETLLVPGDTVTETCSFTLDVAGEHMEGTVVASAPSMTGDAPLTSVLQVAVSDITLNGAPATTFTEVNDGQTLGVSVTVTFPEGTTADNTTQTTSAVLDAITVTATQNHP